MQTANIAEVKDHLSRFLALVEQGEEVAICNAECTGGQDHSGARQKVQPHRVGM